MARVSIFLIMVALITGMVGCGGGGNGGDGGSYTLIVDLTAGGIVTVNNVPIPGTAMFTYAPGTVVSLNATPDAGYCFVNWTGNVSTIGNVNASATNITMNGNYSITANFALGIWDWYDLNAVRNNLTGSYLLMNNLNSTTPGYTELASLTANGGKGWQPIGNYTGGNFAGTFDSQGYVIKDLFINRPDEDFVGLFGAVGSGGIIENVGVVSVAVTGDYDVGGLVGWHDGTVINSYSTGNVTGEDEVGGLVGFNYYGAVINSYSTGNVTGAGYCDVGGLVGWNRYGTVSDSYSTGGVTGNHSVGGLVGNNGGTVSNSYSTGSVTGNEHVGGLVGANGGNVSDSYSTGSVTGEDEVGGLVGYDYEGTVSNSHSTGNVTGEWIVGGLVGYDYDGTVSNCYATGSVTGREMFVGGLVGANSGNVSNSYSTGNVTGNSDVGGLVGLDTGGTVNNSFWDTQTSGQNSSAGGTGKNTTEMKDIMTFSGATWDITTVGGIGERNTGYIWNIVHSVTYPFLSWQP